MPSEKVQALEVVKENIQAIADYAKESEQFLTELATATEGEFPYLKEVQEIIKFAESVAQQVEVDLKAFGEMEAETPATPETPETPGTEA